MVTNKDRTDYQRRYYEENKEMLLLKRKIRYATDPDYRDAIKASVRGIYEKDREERGLDGKTKHYKRRNGNSTSDNSKEKKSLRRDRKTSKAKD